MLYFAYGSNLNRKQMRKRCRDSKYIGCYTLKNYKLVFRNKYYGGGVADIQRKKNSNVLGAIYNISKNDEKILDVYEDFPTMYIKKYFEIFGKKVMFYYMPKKTKPNPPAKIYLNKIIQGYKDCGYKNSYIVISKNKRVKIK